MSGSEAARSYGAVAAAETTSEPSGPVCPACGRALADCRASDETETDSTGYETFGVVGLPPREGADGDSRER